MVPSPSLSGEDLGSSRFLLRLGPRQLLLCELDALLLILLYSVVSILWLLCCWEKGDDRSGRWVDRPHPSLAPPFRFGGLCPRRQPQACVQRDKQCLLDNRPHVSLLKRRSALHVFTKFHSFGQVPGTRIEASEKDVFVCLSRTGMPHSSSTHNMRQGNGIISRANYY